MKSLMLAAILGIQALSFQVSAAMPSPKNLGKAKLPFCTLQTKNGGTAFLHMERGDWAAGGQYSVVIYFLEENLLIENLATLTSNQYGQTITTASVSLKTTLLPMQRNNPNRPAQGELMLGQGVHPKLNSGKQIIACEYSKFAE